MLPDCIEKCRLQQEMRPAAEYAGAAMESDSKFSKRKYEYDIIRILAAFLIIFAHTGIDGMELYRTYSNPSIPYWVYVLAHIMGLTGVALFQFLSGALLLKKKESPGTVLRKRLPRILIVLAVFSAAAYLQRCIDGHVEEPGLFDFIKRLTGNGVITPYWYLYAYIGFLISLPLLRSMARAMDRAEYEYLLRIALVFSLAAPVGIQWTQWAGISLNDFVYPAWLLGDFVLIPLAGYYFAEIAKDEDRNAWLKRAVLICIVCIALMMYTAHAENMSQAGTLPRPFHAVYSLTFPCVLIYLVIKKAVGKIRLSGRLQDALPKVSACCFGMYLVHIIVMNLPLVRDLPDFLKYRLGISSFVSSALFTAAVAVLSFLVTLLLKRIPGLKKLL